MMRRRSLSKNDGISYHSPCRPCLVSCLCNALQSASEHNSLLCTLGSIVLLRFPLFHGPVLPPLPLPNPTPGPCFLTCVSGPRFAVFPRLGISCVQADWLSTSHLSDARLIRDPWLVDAFFMCLLSCNGCQWNDLGGCLLSSFWVDAGSPRRSWRYIACCMGPDVIDGSIRPVSAKNRSSSRPPSASHKSQHAAQG